MLQPGTLRPPVQPRQSRACSSHCRDTVVPSTPSLYILKTQVALQADSNSQAMWKRLLKPLGFHRIP